MAGQHAPLPASGAPVWGRCSGAVMASLGAIDEWSVESAEGEAAHWVGSEVLQEFAETGTAPLCFDMVGEIAPNDVVIDEKMAEGAQVYVDDILSVIDEANLESAREWLLVEHRVHMPQIHPDNWGTLDCAFVLMIMDHIYVWDYKHGHRVTLAKENLQLIDYVAGLVNKFKIDGIKDQQITVHLRIAQPFVYRQTGPVDEWVVKLSDLRGHFNSLRHKAQEAYLNPTMSPGRHCRDCPALRRCNAGKEYAYAFIDYGNRPYAIDTMDGPALTIERGILADGLVVMKDRLEEIEDELQHRIEGGDVTTGLALENGYGNLAWSIEIPQAVALAGQFGADISKAGVLTPTQATAAVPSNLRVAFAQVLKTASKWPITKLKLTQASDTRAARAFRKEQ